MSKTRWKGLSERRYPDCAEWTTKIFYPMVVLAQASNGGKDKWSLIKHCNGSNRVTPSDGSGEKLAEKGDFENWACEWKKSRESHFGVQGSSDHLLWLGIFSEKDRKFPQHNDYLMVVKLWKETAVSVWVQKQQQLTQCLKTSSCSLKQQPQRLRLLLPGKGTGQWLI